MVVGGSPPVRVGRRQAIKRVSIMDALFCCLNVNEIMIKYGLRLRKRQNGKINKVASFARNDTDHV